MTKKSSKGRVKKAWALVTGSHEFIATCSCHNQERPLLCIHEKEEDARKEESVTFNTRAVPIEITFLPTTSNKKSI